MDKQNPPPVPAPKISAWDMSREDIARINAVGHAIMARLRAERAARSEVAALAARTISDASFSAALALQLQKKDML